MRRLFFDIETSPLVVLSWRTGWKINISHENILAERKIICAAWKWEGEETVYSAKWDASQDDKALLQRIVPVLEKADEIVGHWLEGFDMPWVRTRALVHQIQTLPTYKTVDTCKWARRHFYFNSNKLDYVAKLLGIGRKLHTEDGLWRRVVLQKDASVTGVHGQILPVRRGVIGEGLEAITASRPPQVAPRGNEREREVDVPERWVGEREGEQDPRDSGRNEAVPDAVPGLRRLLFGVAKGAERIRRGKAQEKEMSGRYSQAIEGEWQEIAIRGFKEQCCDCSLIHRVDYRITDTPRGHKLEFRCWRDDNATAKIRKRAGIRVRRD